MSRIPPGQLGHDTGAAYVRRQPVRVVDGTIDGDYTDLWEVICPACGDDGDLDYEDVSPLIQRIRGPHGTKADGRAALRRHIGLLG